MVNQIYAQRPVNTAGRRLDDPAVFSDEVHFAILHEGLRGQRLKKLMRVARKNAELEAILETKLSEFRRYLRETRQPTASNLPARIVEWLSDNVRFTPPKQAFMTLVYVVLVLVGLDLFRQQ